MDKSTIISKAIDKSYYKLRGKLLEAKRVGSVTWQFILWKNIKGKDGTTEKTYYVLSTSDATVISKIQGAVRNQRFKAKFKIKSVLVKERWYTNMICYVLDDWKVNEDKLNKEARIQAKQTEMFEESQYQKSSLLNNQNK